jgi:hypothetical protein
VVNQNVPHYPGYRREKMNSISELAELITFKEGQDGFIYECRRLKRVSGVLVLHHLVGNSTQVTLDQHDELSARLTIALPNGMEQLVNF